MAAGCIRWIWSGCHDQKDATKGDEVSSSQKSDNRELQTEVKAEEQEITRTNDVKANAGENHKESKDKLDKKDTESTDNQTDHDEVNRKSPDSGIDEKVVSVSSDDGCVSEKENLKSDKTDGMVSKQVAESTSNADQGQGQDDDQKEQADSNTKHCDKEQLLDVIKDKEVPDECTMAEQIAEQPTCDSDIPAESTETSKTKDDEAAKCSEGETCTSPSDNAQHEESHGETPDVNKENVLCESTNNASDIAKKQLSKSSEEEQVDNNQVPVEESGNKLDETNQNENHPETPVKESTTDQAGDKQNGSEPSGDSNTCEDQENLECQRPVRELIKHFSSFNQGQNSTWPLRKKSSKIRKERNTYVCEQQIAIKAETAESGNIDMSVTQDSVEKCDEGVCERSKSHEKLESLGCSAIIVQERCDPSLPTVDKEVSEIDSKLLAAGERRSSAKCGQAMFRDIVMTSEMLGTLNEGRDDTNQESYDSSLPIVEKEVSEIDSKLLAAGERRSSAQCGQAMFRNIVMTSETLGTLNESRDDTDQESCDRSLPTVDKEVSEIDSKLLAVGERRSSTQCGQAMFRNLGMTSEMLGTLNEGRDGTDSQEKIPEIHVYSPEEIIIAGEIETTDDQQSSSLNTIQDDLKLSEIESSIDSGHMVQSSTEGDKSSCIQMNTEHLDSSVDNLAALSNSIESEIKPTYVEILESGNSDFDANVTTCEMQVIEDEFVIVTVRDELMVEPDLERSDSNDNNIHKTDEPYHHPDETSHHQEEFVILNQVEHIEPIDDEETFDDLYSMIEKGDWKLVTKLSGLVGGMDLAVCPNGDVAITDFMASCVRIYSQNGQYLNTIYSGMERDKWYPYGITVGDNEHFYVTNRSPSVEVFDVHSRYKSQILSAETLPLRNTDIAFGGIAVDSIGHILVGDCSTNRINKLKQDGSLINSIKVGIKPRFISVCLDDTIAVSAWEHDTGVHLIDADSGEVLHTLNAPLNVPYWCPSGVCCFKDIVFVSNCPRALDYSDGIYCFSVVTGECLRCITNDTFFPLGLTTDGKKLMVTELKCVKIFKPV